MAVYIIVGLVAVAVLWAAYRAFGGAASGTPDNLALLRRAAAAGRDAAVAPDESARGTPKQTRKTLEGAMQLLERVDVATLDPDRAAAHALLTTAVEDLTWAARISEAAGFGSNPGLQDAARSLRAHAGRCLDEAERLVPSAVAEEVHRLA